MNDINEQVNNDSNIEYNINKSDNSTLQLNNNTYIDNEPENIEIDEKQS